MQKKRHIIMQNNKKNMNSKRAYKFRLYPDFKRNTSKERSSCGNIQDMPLSERTYLCNRCGMQLDRDINASINILDRATLGQRGSHAQGENRQYISTGNANGLEELRTDPAHSGKPTCFSGGRMSHAYKDCGWRTWVARSIQYG